MEYDERIEAFQYAWEHLSGQLTEAELALTDSLITAVKEAAAVPRENLQMKFLTDAVCDSWDAFRRMVGERILLNETNGLLINRCPDCRAIAKTPEARQCLWCGHDWH